MPSSGPPIRGGINVQFIGDKRAVDVMLFKLDWLLGPAGMSLFLTKQVTPYLQMRAVNRFNNEGDSASGQWAQLEPATVEVRSNLGYPSEHPINVRTGRLERWVAGSTPKLVTSPVLSALTYPGTEPTGRLKEKVKTAQAGKRGKPRKNGKSGVTGATVPRPVLALGSEDYIAILNMLAMDLEGMSRLGFMP